eukprot:m.856115 g.856115  ORF g.856115 m.856115 type:complete len:102 (-) comp23512_c0_seq1:2884-3189(-)
MYASSYSLTVQNGGGTNRMLVAGFSHRSTCRHRFVGFVFPPVIYLLILRAETKDPAKKHVQYGWREYGNIAASVLTLLLGLFTIVMGTKSTVNEIMHPSHS